MASFIFNFNRPLWMKNKRVAWGFLDAKDERTLIHIWHILRLIASLTCMSRYQKVQYFVSDRGEWRSCSTINKRQFCRASAFCM